MADTYFTSHGRRYHLSPVSQERPVGATAQQLSMGSVTQSVVLGLVAAVAVTSLDHWHCGVGARQ